MAGTEDMSQKPELRVLDPFPATVDPGDETRAWLSPKAPGFTESKV